MKLVRDIAACPNELKGAAIALGNFDGVHKGHRAVIEETKAIAKQHNVPAAVLTFEPHPVSILRPDTPPIRITPLRLKAERIRELGIDAMFVLHFTKNFSHMTGNGFITQMLVGKLQAKHIISGYDFMFGHKRSGNAALLQSLGPEHGYGYTQIAPVGEGSLRYSSTAIREALRDGSISKAVDLLGHGYHILGRVSHGEKRGSQIGFPTANIRPKGLLLPKYGVYAAQATTEDGTAYKAAINIGVKPTFGVNAPLVEAHMLDMSENLYGKWLRLDIKAMIREEMRFDGVDTLKAQITHDVKQVRNAL